MSRLTTLSVITFLLTAFAICGNAYGESHRATRLGHPATRFAPTIYTVDDLRGRFKDPRLRPDIESILAQWGWKGDVQDLYAAAETAPVADIAIPIGSTMPFMSSRENGRPICLRNVLWAGDAPAPAYAFVFTSKNHQYRCVTPKACSNFFLEDLGPVLKPALTLNCTAPEEVLVGRAARVCMLLKNTGNGVEPKAFVSLPIPKGAITKSASEGYTIAGGNLTWEFTNIAPGKGIELCATFTQAAPGLLAFEPSAASATTPELRSGCETKVTGLPAILIDAVDLEDPVEVGKEVVYEIKVTNQGTIPGTQVKLVCTLPKSQEYVSGSGPTAVSCEGQTVTTWPLPVLEPKAVATWRVVVKATGAEDVRFLVDLSSDQFELPIHEEESTLLY